MQMRAAERPSVWRALLVTAGWYGWLCECGLRG